MKRDDSIRIRHIADALNWAIQFIHGRRREDLDADRMLTFALLHAIQIVGEAASKASAETRDLHPEIPWASIIGIRHRLVHAYSDVNLDILWTTATEAAPARWRKSKPSSIRIEPWRPPIASASARRWSCSNTTRAVGGSKNAYPRDFAVDRSPSADQQRQSRNAAGKDSGPEGTWR